MKPTRLVAATAALALLPLAAPAMAMAVTTGSHAVPGTVHGVAAPAVLAAAQAPKVLRTLPRQVTAKPGQNVVFRLPSNMTTGYAYTVTVLSNTAGAKVGKPSYVSPSNPIPGQGGTTVVKVTAGHSGTLTLKFRYAQPWTGGDVASVHKVTITWPN